MTEPHSRAPTSCKVTQKINSPISIQQMIQTLLKQINTITEDEFKKMSYEEIAGVYNDFLTESAETAPQETRTQAKKQQKKDIKQDYQKESHKFIGNIFTDQSIPNKIPQPKLRENCVYIKEQSYYPPQYLNKNFYILNNKRLAIICRPEPDTIQQKRKLVCAAVLPNMAENMKILKEKSVENIYRNFKKIDKSEIQVNGKQNKLTQIKKFVVYIEKCHISEGQLKKLKENRQKSLQNPIKATNNKKQTPQKNLSITNFQFFYEKQAQKQNKPQLKQLTIQAAFQSVKDKNKLTTSHASNKKNQRKQKSQLRIIGHFEQIEYYDDNQWTENAKRPRQNDCIDENQGTSLGAPRKMSNINSVQANQNGKQLLDSSMVEWIGKLKQILNKFEELQMDQFESDWIVIHQQ